MRLDLSPRSAVLALVAVMTSLLGQNVLPDSVRPWIIAGLAGLAALTTTGPDDDHYDGP